MVQYQANKQKKKWMLINIRKIIDMNFWVMTQKKAYARNRKVSKILQKSTKKSLKKVMTIATMTMMNGGNQSCSTLHILPNLTSKHFLISSTQNDITKSQTSLLCRLCRCLCRLPHWIRLLLLLVWNIVLYQQKHCLTKHFPFLFHFLLIRNKKILPWKL